MGHMVFSLKSVENISLCFFPSVLSQFTISNDWFLFKTFSYLLTFIHPEMPEAGKHTRIENSSLDLLFLECLLLLIVTSIIRCRNGARPSCTLLSSDFSLVNSIKYPQLVRADYHAWDIR